MIIDLEKFKSGLVSTHEYRAGSYSVGVNGISDVTPTGYNIGQGAPLQNVLEGLQPRDNDLSAISALTTSGWLKRTGTDTWQLDSATVLTASLNIFTSSLKGLAPSSGGGTANYLRADGTWATPAGTTAGANPSAQVGLTAINGSAATFMRSDAAPALNVSITPSWTGAHKFFANPIISSGSPGSGGSREIKLSIYNDLGGGVDEAVLELKTDTGGASNPAYVRFLVPGSGNSWSLGSTDSTSSFRLVNDIGLNGYTAAIQVNSFDSSFYLGSTTNATDTSNGSFHTPGGISLVKDLWVGGISNISGGTTLGTSLTLSYMADKRIPYSASGVITSTTNLTYDSATTTLATVNGTFSGTLTVAGAITSTKAGSGLAQSVSNSGASNTWTLENTSNTASSSAVLNIKAAGASAGTANIVFTNGAGPVNWFFGALANGTFEFNRQSTSGGSQIFKINSLKAMATYGSLFIGTNGSIQNDKAMMLGAGQVLTQGSGTVQYGLVVNPTAGTDATSSYYAEYTIANSNAGTNTLIGKYIDGGTKISGVVDINIGLCIGSQTVGTNNWSIYTNNGISNFGDVVYNRINGANSFALNSSGSDFGFISNLSSNTWALAHGTALGTLGTAVLTWNSSNQVLTAGKISINGGAYFDYDEGSFTGTLTGCTTSPTITVKWIRIGNMVDLWTVGTLLATSNSTACTMTGLPAALFPATQQDIICGGEVQDNGILYCFPFFRIGTGGVIALGFSTTVIDNYTLTFTNTGTKGLCRMFHIRYPLN